MANVKRLDFIDWVKAFCIVLVIITHSDFLNDAMLDKTGLFYLLCVNKAVPTFLFLSGFVFALGTEKRSLCDEYKPKRLFGKLLKLTVPTVIAYAAFVCLKFVSKQGMSIGEIVMRFIAGDFGSGSYYYAIMVQFVFLAPVIYYLIKRFGAWGLVLIGAANFLHDILWGALNLPVGIYRVLAARYLLVIAFGMYTAHLKERKIHPLTVGTSFLLGLCYILYGYFTNYNYRVFTIEPWNRSGMMASFYVAAVMYVLLYFFKNARAKTFVGNITARVGVASYHIMYTQMLYFTVRPAFDTLVFDLTLLPLWSQFVVDIVVCIVTGIVFCVVDNTFFAKFYKTK